MCLNDRVSVIQVLSRVTQWRHVRSKINPADAASRGMKVGPIVTQPPNQWPAGMKETSVPPEADPEVKGEVLSCAAVLKQERCPSPTTKLLMYFSSWAKLKTAVAWLLKLKERLKNQVKEITYTVKRKSVLNRNISGTLNSQLLTCLWQRRP